MSDLRTAAQQALEALELVTDLTNHDDELYAAIDALRAALAQEEQAEPVACPYCKCPSTLGAVYYDQNCAACVKRMTAPPQRKPLTDEEIWALYYDQDHPEGERSDRVDFVRAIERAHGIGGQDES